MKFKEILDQLNIFAQCKKYGLPLWQCPQFLFLLMGIIIITSTLAAYIIGSRYVEDPQLVALLVLFITAVLFILAVIITNSFERLAEASRMKSEFISIVTHQLRSPLVNLKWAIDFLLSEKTEVAKEKRTDYFKILKENAFRMGELIDNLLVVSRIQEGRLAVKKVKISIKDLIKDLIQEFQPYVLASNVKVEFRAPKDLPEFSVDPSQLRLVIDNLLSNAIRYTKGKGKVEIRVSRKKNNLFFEIEDNGVGIPKEDQKYIFQKFFRATNAPKYQPHGSGLGLYIAKAVVEQSGGEIGFQSEEEKGSTFWFSLPFK